MKPASQKLTKYVHGQGRGAKRSTSVGSASSAMQVDANLKTATRKQTMKGRSVLLGDNVKGQDFNWAEFCELGSNPPSIEAAKALDAMGSLPGYRVKTGDAHGACTDALLRGTETCVALPEHRWPKHWRGKYKRPVVPLILALSGHVDAGGFLEEHCE